MLADLLARTLPGLGAGAGIPVGIVTAVDLEAEEAWDFVAEDLVALSEHLRQ